MPLTLTEATALIFRRSNSCRSEVQLAASRGSSACAPVGHLEMTEQISFPVFSSATARLTGSGRWYVAFS